MAKVESESVWKRNPGLTLRLLVVLGFMSTVGPLAMDMYLPAFTDIASDLDASASAVQLTLTTFMVGMGLGQLLIGATSDIFGRRKVLLLALSFFVVSSILLVFIPSIELFIALRIIQGFSGSAGIVLARTIAVDVAGPKDAVRVLSLITTAVGVGPLIAPPIGSFVHGLFGWRGVMTLLAILAAAMLASAFFFVPESLPMENRQPVALKPIFGRFGKFFKDPVFIASVGAFACAYGALSGYISASSFVGQTILGMSSVLYALGFALGASAMIIGNVINANISDRVQVNHMLLVSIAIGIVAAAAMLIQVLAGILTIPGFVITAFCLTAGVGLTMSNASAMALVNAGASRGSGAALLGAFQFLAGGIASPLVGLAGEDSAMPLALVLLGGMILSLFCGLVAYRFYRRRQ